MEYKSNFDIKLAQIAALGGNSSMPYDSEYSENLEILRLLNQGGHGGARIDDSSIATTSVWSSSKTNTQIGTKQDALVSGTNIKTINGESVLGSGDISISAGALIDDSDTSTGKVWSSSKTSTQIGTKQDTLVSGTNIKTINSQSIVGSGNIIITDIDDSKTSSDVTWSSEKIQSELEEKANISDVSTKFADVSTKIAGKTDTSIFET